MNFNQTEYKFTASFDISSGTQLGTAWISMPKSLIFPKDDKPLLPLQINYLDYDFDGLSVHYDLYPYESLVWGNFDIDLYFAGKKHMLEESSQADLFNFTLDDVISCKNEYILIPIDIYTRSELYGIGTYPFKIYLSLNINNTEDVYAHTDFSVVTSSGKYLWNVFSGLSLLEWWKLYGSVIWIALLFIFVSV